MYDIEKVIERNFRLGYGLALEQMLSAIQYLYSRKAPTTLDELEGAIQDLADQEGVEL